MRSRFIIPDTERLDLSDGDSLTVKNELAWGETLLLNTALEQAFARTQNGPINEGFRDYFLTRAAIWITDWSFTDAKGNLVPWDDGQERPALEELLRRRELLASLDSATGNEINTVLNAHEERVRGKAGPETAKIEGSMTTPASEVPPLLHAVEEATSP